MAIEEEGKKIGKEESFERFEYQGESYVPSAYLGTYVPTTAIHLSYPGISVCRTYLVYDYLVLLVNMSGDLHLSFHTVSAATQDLKIEPKAIRLHRTSTAWFFFLIWLRFRGLPKFQAVLAHGRFWLLPI